MLEGNVRNIVGKQVCRLRKLGGLTQDDLAARCTVRGFEIGRSTVSHIETGLRGVSDLEMVMLANALRVPVAELIPAKLPKWKRDVRPPTADKSE
ncbi:MAG: helix-turn-helix transcriptional regulator [Luteolibacter sp.]